MGIGIDSINEALGCVCIALGAYLFFVAVKTNMLFYCTNMQVHMNAIIPVLASFLVFVGSLVITFSLKNRSKG
ncbi:hypothetical protein GF351_00905 [Candidatus Woesearchaeota archaeon]|nr:hypothetical protein [Candidatus Woesearchaeota archaeon]